MVALGVPAKEIALFDFWDAAMLIKEIHPIMPRNLFPGMRVE
jgi:hypothetical protein